MLPAAINAGCDMFLFFNDPEEDFSTMLEAYQTGTITEARMTEACRRALIGSICIKLVFQRADYRHNDPCGTILEITCFSLRMFLSIQQAIPSTMKCAIPDMSTVSR